MKNPALWGRLRSRYETKQPRKMLSLDGGGIRGILTLAILERMEKLLADRTGKGEAFRLCDYFDYIAGTSTGAIIATALARGMAVSELMKFYLDFGEKMFEGGKLSLIFRRSMYSDGPIQKKLQEVFGAQSNLSPDNLRCLLLVVTRNATTDSPWPISSNPEAKYNDPGRKDCNLKIPLWQLVRASTAAPIYFPPEVLQWDPADPEKSFVFVDGGVTPYNNPAFLLYRMATHPAYRLGWPQGERNLLLVSVGTGAAAQLGASIASPSRSLVSNMGHLPGELLNGSLADQDLNCRVVGRCTHGDEIDRELFDLVERDCGYEVTREQFLQASPIPLEHDLGRAFLYARYNADLSTAGLEALGFTQLDSEKIQEMDNVRNIDSLLKIGQAVGQKVRLEHFGSFV